MDNTKKIKFSIPTNWQKDLIPKIKREDIDEVYGKLAVDFVGGGRPSFALPRISKKEAADYVLEMHRNGLNFNYLLNALCLDNKEWTISGQKKIHRLLEWIVKIGVDSVTVTIPYLLELIKKHYPKLKVHVSSFAGVNSIERAKYWEDLGANSITLFYPDVNRDFQLMSAIRANIKCELKLIANDDCLYHCPFAAYHSASTSHASQIGHPSRGFIIEYCRISCRYRQMEDIINFVRAPWIRPEDIGYYEDIGIDKIKLVGRGMTTEAISLIVNAYSNRYYDGNLLDLFPRPSKSIMLQKTNLIHKLRYFLRPSAINIFRFLKSKDLLKEAEIYIDNRALDGFIEYFLKEDCRLKSCQDCGYCERIAKKAVRFVPATREQAIQHYKKYLDELISGKMFRYL